MARRLLAAFAAVVLVFQQGIAASPVSLGHEPQGNSGHMLATTSDSDAAALALLPSGFQDQAVITGLDHPTVIQFAPNGWIFVAEKSGLIKVFDSLTDTTPTTFADLRTQVHDFWDRGLLGMAVPPNFPTNPYVYVLYAYNAPIGGTAPVWGDACPTPPGPNTDGCVISGRLSRLEASGQVMIGGEQPLINDWCQQFPSHSTGSLAFGADGALYVSAGDGASFTFADYGQAGGSAGSPTQRNPCGDPPGGFGGVQSPPAAEGGALRSQDVRTLSTASSNYVSTVQADSPAAWWRLGETGGSVAADQVGGNPGTYGAGATLGAAGALTGDANTSVDVAGLNGQRPVVVPHSASLDLGNGPFTLEAWARRDVVGTIDTVLDYGYDTAPGGPALLFVGDKFGLWQNGVGNIAQETGTTTDTGWHHYAATYDGVTARVYKDGVLVSGATNPRTLSNQAGPFLIGANRDSGEEFDGRIDEVAIYRSVLDASRIAAHYNAGVNPDPTSLDGSVLRLDPTTGAAMAGNPLGSSSDHNARRIVAHGFRNPFRFTIRPGTNELWVADVGWGAWEELDLIATPTAGLLNFGWPCYEGQGRQPGYDGLNLALCESLYTSGAVAAPYFTYNHSAKVVPDETCPTANGSSVAGLAFYQGGTYPSSFNGGLFFSDYSRDCVWFMPALANGRPNTGAVTKFIEGASNPVDLRIGPGGDLFYADFDNGAIRRVTFASSNQPPTARPQATPTSGAAPLTVNFNGSTSSDPEGGALTFAWDFDGNGTDDATTAVASHTYTNPGTYLARLRVTDPGGASHSATVSISVNNTAPAAFIDSPSSALTWAVGDAIAFSGHATDPEDGTLAAARLSWSVEMHHCPTDPNACHIHPIQTFNGVASGSFAAPDHEYPSFLLLRLTATDSGGLQASTTVRLDPKTVNLSFASAPTGLQLTVGSSTSVAPFSRTVIQGSRISITAPSPQDVGGVRYAWASWSDGQARAHDVVPTASTTYTATFQAISADVSVTQSVQVGSSQSTITLQVRNNGPATATGVTLTDQLPTRLSFVSASSTVGTCTYQSSTRTVQCSFGSMNSGALATVTIVTDNSQKKGNVTNTATVAATSPDLNTSNNSATASIRIR